jgi:hypothetical protein
MADLAAVQAGTNTDRPRVGPEFISISDFDGLVDLLIACGEQIPESPSIRGGLETPLQKAARVAQTRLESSWLNPKTRWDETAHR